jgi:hypothetical protein
MRHWLLSGLVAFVVLTFTPFAFAQGSVSALIAKIPFEFTVGKQALPSGDYRVVIRPEDAPTLRLLSVDGKTAVTFMAITRLASQHTGDAPKASLVFDTIGEKRFLSEVWVNGSDGYLVLATRAAHTHALVEVQNP